MDAAANGRQEIVRTAFEQHCTQTRHLENQRLVLTVVFAAVYAGCLITMYGNLFDPVRWPTVAFLTLFAFCGFLFCGETQKTTDTYMRAADLVLARYDLKHYAPQAHVNPAAGLFALFFLVCFCFSLFILFRMALQIVWPSIVFPGLLAIIGAITITRSRNEQPADAKEQ